MDKKLTDGMMGCRGASGRTLRCSCKLGDTHYQYRDYSIVRRGWHPACSDPAYFLVSLMFPMTVQARVPDHSTPVQMAENNTSQKRKNMVWITCGGLDYLVWWQSLPPSCMRRVSQEKQPSTITELLRSYPGGNFQAPSVPKLVCKVYLQKQQF
eukprot:1556538-Rhodomonas_salina.1